MEMIYTTRSPKDLLCSGDATLLALVPPTAFVKASSCAPFPAHLTRLGAAVLSSLVLHLTISITT